MMANRIFRSIWRLNHRSLQLPTVATRNTPSYAKGSTTPGIRGSQFMVLSPNFSTRPVANLTNNSENGTQEYLDKLKTSQTATGSVNFQVLVKTVEGLDGILSEAQAEFLLDCCAHSLPDQTREDKLEMFRKIWEHVRKNDLHTDRICVVALGVLQVNNAPISDFQEIFDECRNRSSGPMYEGLIWLSCSNGEVAKAMEILEEMRSKNFPLTGNVFNALILGHGRNKDLEGIKSVLETMSAANIEPTTETYSILARSYIKNGEFTKAEGILSERQGSFNTEQIVAVIKTAAEEGLGSLVEQCVKLLPKDVLNMKEVPPVVRNVCTELTFSGHPSKAFLIIDAFPKPIFGENQDRDTFGVFFLIDLIKSRQPAEEVLYFCNKLISREKNVRSLQRACEFALRSNAEDILVYFKALSEIEPLRPHYFWPLFISSFKVNGDIGVLNTLREMTQLGAEPDYETLLTYVLPKLSVILENEQKAVKALEDCGLKTSQFMTPLAAQLMYHQRVDELVALCKLYQTRLDTQLLLYPLITLTVYIKATGRYRKLGRLLSTLDAKSEDQNYDFVGKYLIEVLMSPKLSDNDLIKKILPELEKHNLKISPTAYEVLSSHLSKNERDGDSSQKIFRDMINKRLNLPASEYAGSHITHPRDMNMEQLECHLVELESKGMNTRGVLRRLLQVCVREGKLERALEVKEQCDRLKVLLSPGMLASIFDLYIKLKRLNEAKSCLLQIKKTFPGFLLDEHKIIDFAGLLIEKNCFDDAKEVLMKRADTSKVIGGDYINKNLWNLLTNSAKVAAQEASPDIPNKTKEIFQLLHELKYCRPSNVLLGPIIREYLLRKNIKAAVAEFEEFSEKYRTTPLLFELMSLLVSLSNEQGTEEYGIPPTEARELLHRVIEASAKIHGSANINSTLVLAVANSGTEAQLRKLLINPEIRLNPEALIRNCEHLSITGSIDIILKLARAGRGMGHAVKETELYNILLNNFVKENNYSAAEALFDKLESDDESKITQNFLKTLIDLFRANNLDIPTNIALRTRATL